MLENQRENQDSDNSDESKDKKLVMQSSKGPNQNEKINNKLTENYIREEIVVDCKSNQIFHSISYIFIFESAENSMN
jgi:hypothetical protein